MNLNAGFGLFTFYLVVVVVAVVEAWRLKPTRRSPQNSAWLLYLEGIITLPTARNSNEVARTR